VSWNSLAGFQILDLSHACAEAQGGPGKPREAQGSWDLAIGQKVEHPPGVSL